MHLHLPERGSCCIRGVLVSCASASPGYGVCLQKLCHSCRATLGTKHAPPPSVVVARLKCCLCGHSCVCRSCRHLLFVVACQIEGQIVCNHVDTGAACFTSRHHWLQRGVDGEGDQPTNQPQAANRRPFTSQHVAAHSQHTHIPVRQHTAHTCIAAAGRQPFQLQTTLTTCPSLPCRSCALLLRLFLRAPPVMPRVLPSFCL